MGENNKGCWLCSVMPITLNRWKHTNTHIYPFNPFPFSCSATLSTLYITMETASWQQLEDSQFVSNSHQVSSTLRSGDVSECPAAYYGLAKWWLGEFNIFLISVTCQQWLVPSEGFSLLCIFIKPFLNHLSSCQHLNSFTLYPSLQHFNRIFNTGVTHA